jgi:hypothetical protein
MKKLDVYLTGYAGSRSGDDRGRLVGTLAESERRIYFEYDAAFLEDPLWFAT